MKMKLNELIVLKNLIKRRVVVGSGDCPIRPESAYERLMGSKRGCEPDSTRSRHPSAGMATARWIGIAQHFGANHLVGQPARPRRTVAATERDVKLGSFFHQVYLSPFTFHFSPLQYVCF